MVWAACPMYLPESFRRSYLPWFLELALGLIARCLYRVRVHGRDNIPAQGGVLLVSNHISHVDFLVLQMACRRRIRFVVQEQIKPTWFLKLAVYLGGAIFISARDSLDGTRRIARALKAGDVVCMFPEGAITRTGQLMELRRGFEVVARKAGVPVLPVSHDGLWGSVFSSSGNRYLFKSPRLMSTHVCVCFGEPIPVAQLSAGRVRRDLLDLGAVAFGERPALRRNLAREVVRSLAKRPRLIELVDRTAERKEVRAATLLAVSAAYSRRILKTIPDKRVGIVLPPGAGAAIANIATICAGKVPVNLNFTAGRSSVQASLDQAGIRYVISAGAVRAKVPNFPWPERTLDLKDELTAIGKPRILAWMAAAWLLPNQLIPRLLGIPKTGGDEEVALLFTSGSSGEPKGVVLTHRNILANCCQISSLSILPDSSRLLACLPVFHSFGFTITLWYTILRGCRSITVPSPLDTRKVIDAIRDEEATVFIGAPTFLRPVLKKADPAELRSLKLLVSGAEKMPLELYDAFLERFNIELLQGYGLTETTPVANINQPDPPITHPLSEYQPGKRLGSVGRMLPGMTARVIHPETREDLPLTETGILLLRGANVFKGYLDDPEKTSAAFHKGWFVTGDLGRFDEAGFMYIEGRLSRFSKIGGEMVPHGTIEQKLVDGFSWDQSEGPVVVIAGIPDSARGEVLVLLTTQEVSADEVRDKLVAAGLPNLWIPRTVLRVKEIPALGTGKVDMKACRELAIAESAARTDAQLLVAGRA